MTATGDVTYASAWTGNVTADITCHLLLFCCSRRDTFRNTRYRQRFSLRLTSRICCALRVACCTLRSVSSTPKLRARRGTSNPRPKACVSLDAIAVEALRALVARSSKRHAANTLAVSDTCVRRVLAGEPVTPALHRLLMLQLCAPNTHTASAA